MRIKERSWWFGMTALFGTLVVMLQNAENTVSAQGVMNPLPQPTPLPLPPSGSTPSGPGGMIQPGPGGKATTGPVAVPGPEVPYPGENSLKAAVVPYTVPSILTQERPLPIDLATALRLANAQAWDVGIAAQEIRAASARLTRANVLWLPTLVAGADYQHHDGTYQDQSNGAFVNNNRNAIELGGAPEVVFAFTEAIYEPLAARQDLKSSKAQLQAATNDTTLNVARAYFDAQEARGFLAGTMDTIKRTKEVVRRIEAMAPALVPDVEVYRARAQLAQFEQVEQTLRENWVVASAEIARLVRLDPAAVVIPLEPPHMQVTLVSADQPLDNLLPVALAARPELISYQALTQAALKRWKEEQYRPLMPSVYFRGGTNQLPDTMMFGAQTGGPNGTFGTFKGRADYEVEVMWELRNLGFGNAAAMRERRAQYDVARMRAYRLQDIVAREVTQAYAQVRSARARAIRAEVELREAEISAYKNYEGLGAVKRIGDIVIPVIRPQEAVVAMSALLQAYRDYFGSIADYNRSQFTLYHALGNPAQLLPMLNASDPNCNGGANPNPLPPPPAAPPAPNAVNNANEANRVVPDGATAMEMNRSMVNPAAAAQAAPARSVDPISATLLVRVPVNAEVYCDGVKLTLTGSERNFLSPPLPLGKTYPYEIRARWMGNDGKPVEQVRQVQVQGGQRTTVDFLARSPNP